VAGNQDQIRLPPERLGRRPVLRADRPGELWRLHWEEDPSIPRQANPGRWRFDAPKGEYPVTYANGERHHVFVEVYGDTDDRREIAPDQADRKISSGSVGRDLLLVDLGDAETLARLELDGRINTTLEYGRTQLWSRFLHDGLDQADGIRYPGRKAGREDNFCLFLDRCGDAITWDRVGTIAGERALVLNACVMFDITPRVFLEPRVDESWPADD
jgi:hypothetical protein